MREKLTDNKVQQMMSEFKPTQDLHGMNAKYIYQNALQSSVFSHFADIDGSWNGLSVADVFGDKEIKVGYVNGVGLVQAKIWRRFLLSFH